MINFIWLGDDGTFRESTYDYLTYANLSNFLGFDPYRVQFACGKTIKEKEFSEKEANRIILPIRGFLTIVRE